MENGGFFIFMFTVILYFIFAFPIYKLALKANHHSPFWAWIPFLNIIQIMQIARLSVWYLILLFIPFVNIFVIFYIHYKYLSYFCDVHALLIIAILFCPALAYYIVAFSGGINDSVSGH